MVAGANEKNASFLISDLARWFGIARLKIDSEKALQGQIRSLDCGFVACHGSRELV
jgi:hypothetical protein